MGPKSYSEILFLNPIPTRILAQHRWAPNPIPKSYSDQNFGPAQVGPKSYSEILKPKS